MARNGNRARTIVVKVGSAVLAKAGELNPSAVQRIVGDVRAVLDGEGSPRVVIVSSGAVASGFRALGLDRPPREIIGKQAAAAVGQPRLMSAYAAAFARAGKTRPREVAQVLLTAEDIDHRTRFLNARNTLEALLDASVVPIINENDSVSFAEIKLGDNDHLSAMVAGLVHADLLVILSSVAGVWDRAWVDAGKPGGASKAVIVSEIRSLAEAQRHVLTSTSEVGTGGMATKVKAACTAAALGTRVVVADGTLRGRVLERIVHGEALGTCFPAFGGLPDQERTGRSTLIESGALELRQSARKKWIGFSARPKGTLRVDAGAERAMVARGASLLPSGICEVTGSFARGALVELFHSEGKPIARGLSAYSADELRLIAGKKSREIAGVLGYCYRDEAIHRDDLVLVAPSEKQHARSGERGGLAQ